MASVGASVYVRAAVLLLSAAPVVSWRGCSTHGTGSTRKWQMPGVCGMCMTDDTH
jgi:hypothetical protein